MEYAIWLPLPVILAFGFMGFKDGVIKRALEIVGIIATLILTARFATAALPWMIDKTGLPEGAALFITWAALFLVGFLASKLLATFLSKLIRLTILGWVDRWGGAVIGVVIGTLFCSVILVAASQISGGKRIQAAYEHSTAGRLLFHAAPNMYRAVRGLSGGRAEEVWTRVLDQAKDQADEAADNVRDAASSAAGAAVRDQVDETREQMEEKLDDIKDSAGG